MTTTIAKPRRLVLRHAWLVPALAFAFLANALATDHGVGLLPVLTFGILPHLTSLAGIGQPHERGQLARRAVPLFNAAHHPVPPLAVLGLAAAGLLSPFWLVAALAWLGHIVADLAFGEGLRTAEGFRRRGWTSQ
jgi:hypothetical protein